MVQPAGEVPERLSRDMGCTPDDLVRWMPQATGQRPLRWFPDGCELALVQGGQVRFRWTVLPPRRIALMRIQRVRLEIVFQGCTAAQRREFIERFDAYTRRGGG